MLVGFLVCMMRWAGVRGKVVFRLPCFVRVQQACCRAFGHMMRAFFFSSCSAGLGFEGELRDCGHGEESGKREGKGGYYCAAFVV